MGVAPSAPVQLPNVKVLYLFAGKQRQADVGSCLKQMQAKGQIVLELLEFDIARSEDHDLRSDELWQRIIDRLRQGNWFLIVSPPCNTFSRARFQEVAPRPKAFEESNMAKGFSMAFIVEPKHCVRSQ